MRAREFLYQDSVVQIHFLLPTGPTYLGSMLSLYRYCAYQLQIIEYIAAAGSSSISGMSRVSILSSCYHLPPPSIVYHRIASHAMYSSEELAVAITAQESPHNPSKLQR